MFAPICSWQLHVYRALNTAEPQALSFECYNNTNKQYYFSVISTAIVSCLALTLKLQAAPVLFATRRPTYSPLNKPHALSPVVVPAPVEHISPLATPAWQPSPNRSQCCKSGCCQYHLQIAKDLRISYPFLLQALIELQKLHRVTVITVPQINQIFHCTTH